MLITQSVREKESADITPSKLLNESVDFINEHGGYNADYRLSFINRAKHIVDYQSCCDG